MEELKLGQGFLKELDSADLVDRSEDEEEHNWAHGLHLGPVMGGILLLCSSNHRAMSSVSIARLSISSVPKSWSEHSVGFSSAIPFFFRWLLSFLFHFPVIDWLLSLVLS